MAAYKTAESFWRLRFPPALRGKSQMYCLVQRQAGCAQQSTAEAMSERVENEPNPHAEARANGPQTSVSSRAFVTLWLRAVSSKTNTRRTPLHRFASATAAATPPSNARMVIQALFTATRDRILVCSGHPVALPPRAARCGVVSDARNVSQSSPKAR